MEDCKHREVVQRIRDAHKCLIENILQYLNAGEIEKAKEICNFLMDIYNKKENEK